VTISFWLKKVVSVPLPSVVHGSSQMDNVELRRQEGPGWVTLLSGDGISLNKLTTPQRRSRRWAKTIVFFNTHLNA
jgi:hypothetical protein